MSRVFGYRDISNMEKTHKVRMSIADNLRRAAFNPTNDDVLLVWLGASLLLAVAVTFTVGWMS